MEIKKFIKDEFIIVDDKIMKPIEMEKQSTVDILLNMQIKDNYVVKPMLMEIKEIFIKIWYKWEDDTCSCSSLSSGGSCCGYEKEFPNLYIPEEFKELVILVLRSNNINLLDYILKEVSKWTNASTEDMYNSYRDIANESKCEYMNFNYWVVERIMEYYPKEYFETHDLEFTFGESWMIPPYDYDSIRDKLLMYCDTDDVHENVYDGLRTLFKIKEYMGWDDIYFMKKLGSGGNTYKEPFFRYKELLDSKQQRLLLHSVVFFSSWDSNTYYFELDDAMVYTENLLKDLNLGDISSIVLDYVFDI